MVALVLQSFRHILRTRMLLFLLLFSVLIQYVGVKAVTSVTIHIQGIISKFDNKDALFVALLFQIFTGGFLSAAFGIWIIPYNHQGQRSPLTFSLPISKWYFPLAYAVSVLLVLLLQNIILLICFGVNFGLGSFPWSGFLAAAALESLAFLVCTFGFATATMALGPGPAFFLGSTVISLLQLAGAVLRLDVPSLADARRVYEFMPPVGELVYDLRQSYLSAGWDTRHLVLWAIWLGLFVLLFRYQLRFPAKIRGGET